MMTDLVQPLPTTSEWRSSVDVRLETMEHNLGNLQGKLDRVLECLEGAGKKRAKGSRHYKVREESSGATDEDVGGWL